MIGNNLYVQYGCGLSAPKEWVNFDVSPTLKVQKIPFAGNFIAQKIQGFTFPENVLYGDITILFLYFYYLCYFHPNHIVFN